MNPGRWARASILRRSGTGARFSTVEVGARPPSIPRGRPGWHSAAAGHPALGAARDFHSRAGSSPGLVANCTRWCSSGRTTPGQAAPPSYGGLYLRSPPGAGDRALEPAWRGGLPGAPGRLQGRKRASAASCTPAASPQSNAGWDRLAAQQLRALGLCPAQGDR
jgi:hypothetical protein